MTIVSFLSRGIPWYVEVGDALSVLRGLPTDSVDLCFFSPPYEAARTYGIDFDLRGESWVKWMVEVFTLCRAACTGLVACVCEGQTRKFRWSGVPALLMADLHRAGFHLRKPPIYHRIGIPGSGGPDWLRNDWEWIVCTTRGGKLPWSDNTAMGHPPKWAPGGEMSNRKVNGQRVNQMDEWHEEPSPKPHATTRGSKNGDAMILPGYYPPALANPGNVIHCKVGGGLMGNELCHENEAPFPEKLAEFFVRSFCPPGGVVCDPFSGSGTTGSMAIQYGRRFIGCDIRESQVELSRKRIRETTPVFDIMA